MSNFQIARDKDVMRKKNMVAAKKLRKAIWKYNRTFIKSADLDKHSVVLTTFNPTDDTFLQQSTFLFEPMSADDMAKHKPNETLMRSLPMHFTWFTESNKGKLHEYDASERLSHYQRAFGLVSYLSCQVSGVPRTGIDYNQGTLADMSHWEVIDDDDSFHEHAMIDRGSQTKTTARWGCDPPEQYVEPTWDKGSDNSVTAYPHIMLTLMSGACAEDGKLLHCELLSIICAIYNRMKQEEFQEKFYFPVLTISLFGPQHGRILHAHYNMSGKLEVQMTKCFSFETHDEAPIDLFVRFMMSKPLTGEEDVSTPDRSSFLDPAIAATPVLQERGDTRLNKISNDLQPTNK